MWQAGEPGCGVQLHWPTSRWAVWVVASGYKSLRILQPYTKWACAEGKMGCHLHQRVWFSSSSRHGWGWQTNLSSLSPSGVLSGWDWWRSLHRFYSCYTGNERGEDTGCVYNWDGNTTVLLFRNSREHTAGFTCFIPSIESIFLHYCWPFSKAYHIFQIPYLP